MDDNFEVAFFFSTNLFRNVGKEYVNVGNLVEYLVWMGIGGWVVDLDSWAILIGREWTKFFEGDPKEKINRNGIFRKKPAIEWIIATMFIISGIIYPVTSH